MATTIGVINQDHLFSRSTELFLTHLLDLQQDIDNSSLAADNVYRENFKSKFNRVELVTSPPYQALNSGVINDITPTYVETVTTHTLFAKNSDVLLSIDSVRSAFLVIKEIAESLANPIEFSNVTGYLNEAIAKPVYDSSFVDKLVLNRVEISASELEQVKLAYVALMNKFNLTDDTLVNVLSSITTKSLVFDLDYLLDYVNGKLTAVTNLIVDFSNKESDYYNYLMKDSLGNYRTDYNDIHEVLYSPDLVKQFIEDLNGIYKSYVLMIHKMFNELGYPLGAVNDLLTVIDAAIVNSNINITANNILNDKSSDVPANLSNLDYIDQALSNPNFPVLQSESEVDYLIEIASQIQVPKASTYNNDIQAISNQLTPGMMNSALGPTLTNSSELLSGASANQAIKQDDNKVAWDLAIVRSGSILDKIRTILINLIPSSSGYNFNFGFIDKLNALMNVIQALLNTMTAFICGVKAMICALVNLVKSLINLLGSLLGLGKSLKQQAMDRWATINNKLKDYHKTIATIEVASKSNGIIMGKMDAVTASVAGILGQAKADLFRQCYAKATSITVESVKSDASIISNFTSLFDAEVNYYLNQYSSLPDRVKCTGGADGGLNITLPNWPTIRTNLSMPRLPRLNIGCL